MKTINITPTWEAVVSMCMQVLEEPLSEEYAKKACRRELLRLADIVDKQIEEERNKRG